MTAASGPTPVFVVVPSLKITGGTKEIVVLARDIAAAGGDARIVAMWRTRDEVSCAPLPVTYLSAAAIGPARALFGMPAVVMRFVALKRRHLQANWMLSHYVTYALAPFVAGRRLWFFVQDLEWTFVRPRLRGPLRRFILGSLARGRTVAANSYLAAALTANRVTVAATIPIWASPVFRGALDGARDIDVALMVRRGAHKRADLARAVLALRRRRHPHLRMAVITPNDEFAREFGGAPGVELLVRPTPEQMRAIYERAKVFLLLSEHEGFGLPALEAMGSGCVPLCRDAGGVRAYMHGEFHDNLLPLSLGADAILDRAAALSRDQPRLSELRPAARRLFEEGLARVARRQADLAACGIL